MQPNNLCQGKKNLLLIRILLLFFLFAWSVSFVQAQELSDSIVNQRIRFLQKSLKSDQRGTKQWWVGWFAGYGAATAGQGIVYFSSSDKATRQDMAVGAATTFIGAVGQFISPFQPLSFADKLDQLPESSATGRLDKMTQMERFLADRSLMENEARKWKAHLLPTTVNLASGLVTWLGFHRSVRDGFANFALNCVVSEAQIWSQPIRAKRELKRYNERFGKENISIHPPREINWNFIVSTGGAGVRVIF